MVTRHHIDPHYNIHVYILIVMAIQPNFYHATHMKLMDIGELWQSIFRCLM